jgi:hypothetical protein
VETSLRTLAITQNITLDGSIEMLGAWFDPQGQASQDSSDLLDEHPPTSSKCLPADTRGSERVSC